MQPLLAVLLVASFVAVVYGHGRMLWPINRSSMFRYGYDVPPNYKDTGLNCGGYAHHWETNNGRCGTCGDPYDAVRDNEAGGKYASGIISGHFQPGEVINIFLQLTADHDGWSEWRVCPNNDVNKPATQECFDQYLLELADGSGTRWQHFGTNGNYTIPVRLPAGLTCDQCVVQWLWVCGNRWGCSDDCVEPQNNNCGRGCGDQEWFMGCADISIHN